MRHAVLVLSLLLTLTAAARADFDTLLTAARNGDSASVLHLLAAGDTPNPPSFHQGYAPLQFAAQHNDLAVVRALLAAGADTEYRDHNGDRALLWAARGDNAGTLRLLLEAGSPPDSGLDPYGRTALMDASFAGNPDSVRLLLEHGADPHRFDQSAETALHYAVWGGNADVARLLLAAGAHPGVISDNLFRTPLHLAATYGTPELIIMLLEHGPRDARDSDGSTPLLLAALSNRTENVGALLSAGAVPDIADDNGLTPLMVAARDGRVEMADLLLDAGARVDLVDHSGQGLDAYLKWHPVAVPLPEGSRAASLDSEPHPDEIARLDAAHEAIRALIAGR